MVAVGTTEARDMAVAAGVAEWVLPIMAVAQTVVASFAPMQVAEVTIHRTEVTTGIVFHVLMPVEEEASIHKTELITGIVLPAPITMVTIEDGEILVIHKV